MSNTKIALTRMLLFAAALMILSCASPMRLTDNWRNSTYTGPAFKKIMVVALTKHDDLTATDRERVRQTTQVAGRRGGHVP